MKRSISLLGLWIAANIFIASIAFAESTPSQPAFVTNIPRAPALTLNYPGASPCNTTLQACISAASNGDVVNVATGTYVTNSLIITRAITLQGAGSSSTILQPLGAQRVITIGVNITAGVTISNLRVFSGTLTSGTEGGAGIFAGAGSPVTVMNADVLSNTLSPSLGESGGGILANAPITLVNVSFTGNAAFFGAGGGLRAVSTANITGGKFERNVSFNPGGAMRANGAITLNNVTVISNSITAAAQGGGGLRADGGLTMVGGLVQNNVAPDLGGGIFATTASITGSQIISNAGSNGGGLYVTGALAIANTTFDKNTALSGNGGAINSSGSVTITLEGTDSISKTTISNSNGNTNGGGIYAAGNVRLIGEVSFSSNFANTGEGGAIYTNDVTDASGNSVLLIVHFTGNNSAGNGGAIRALGKVNLLNSPAFQNNSAGSGTTADGGAVYADGTVFLSRGSSTGNSARNGGAVYASNDIFFNVHNTGPNTALQNGGCAYSLTKISYNSANATSCSAGQNGGAAFSPSTVLLTGNGVGLFKQNQANNKGGMAFANVVTVRDSTMFSNTASLGGGAVVATTTLDISNSTIMTNTAGAVGGAAVTLNGNTFITNTLFASNQVTNSTGIGGAVWVTGTATISSSTFMSNTTGLGATAGGGGLGASNRITLLGGSFQGNQAVTGGGVLGLDVIANGTTFTNNGTVNNRLGGGIAASNAVTLTSVTMTGNHVCCTNASGGAISTTLAFITGSQFIQNSAFISGSVMIANQVFITNSHFISNFGAGEGGGIWTKSGGSIRNTEFTGNSTGCCSSHKGGALYTKGQIFIFNSQFNNNDSDTGGAIFMQGNFSEIHDSQFNGNFVSCCSGGGAISSVGFGPFIFNSQFTGNHVDCCDDGGAISANGSALDVEQSTFNNNFTSNGNGGAIFTPNDPSINTAITATTFISNSASSHGGAVFLHNATVNNSTFTSNHVSSSSNGGAIAAFGGALLDGDNFTNNRVDSVAGACGTGMGGAIFGDSSTSLTVQNSTFVNSSAPRGGAIFAAGGGLVQKSSFTDNSVNCPDPSFFSNVGFGGAIVAQNALTVKRSSFLRNSAGSLGGGAIFYQPSSATTLRVENTLFARNTATNSVFGAVGAAVAVTNTNTTQLFYNTFANGTTQNSTSAIAIHNGSASVIDNIIANHATGIQKIGGTASEDFNLFFNNASNTSGGVASGGSSFTANPSFVSAAVDNYHITLGSPAINAASNLGFTEDYDGDARPLGGGYDIGFDEFLPFNFHLFLPVILR